MVFMPARLSKNEIRKYLRQIKKWKIKGKAIERHYKFRNFIQAMKFVNKIAKLAEKEEHHPDILIYSWNHVKISTYTHSINGLSEYDFMLASKINRLR